MKQSKRQKAGETSLEGAGIILIMGGVGAIQTDITYAAISIVVGLALIYLSKEYRNSIIFFDPQELVDQLYDIIEGEEKDES